MSKSKLFLSICISFIVGIAIYNVLPEAKNIYWFSGMIVFLVIAVLFWQNKKFRLIGLIGLFLFLGIWRYGVSIPEISSDKIQYYNGQEIVFEGVVATETDLRKNNQKLTIKTQNIFAPDCHFDRSLMSDSKLSGAEKSFKQENNSRGSSATLRCGRNGKTGYFVSGKVLVTTDLYPKYNHGDKLQIKCKLKTPEPFNDFSYDKYLARYDIYSVCYWPEVNLIENGRGLKNKLFAIKQKARDMINYGLREPESSLANAMLLGYKKTIPDELRNSFSRAGLSHIIAISGMHIGIILIILGGIFLRLGLNRKKVLILSSLFLIFYIILIGAPTSAIRAGLMGFLALLAVNFGRLKKVENILAFVCAILLFINPKLLRDDIGFQLSFLAVLGIAIFYLFFKERFIEKIESKGFKFILEILAVTISAQILTWPIIAVNFGTVSLIAPLSNLLVLWLLPFLLATIIMAIFLSFILPSFSIIFFGPSFLILKFTIFIANVLSNLPWAYLEIGNFSMVWTWGYYIIIGGLVYFFKISM